MKLYSKFVPRCLAVLSLLAAALPLPSALAQSTSAVPGLFNFQGKVVNAAGAPLGASPSPVNRLVIFRIWNSSTLSAATNLIYSEQQMVTITDGEFSVLIGAGAPVNGTPLGYSEATKGPSPSFTLSDAAVFGGATRFLGITVDDGTTAPDPEIAPRQQLVTSAYAFRAKYAESLGTAGGSSMIVQDNGNVGIGNPSPNTRLDISGTVFATTYRATASQPTHVQGAHLEWNKDGTGLTYLLNQKGQGHGGMVFGEVDTANNITERIRIAPNGDVGIGVSNPNGTLDVNGYIRVSSPTSNSAGIIALGNRLNGTGYYDTGIFRGRIGSLVGGDFLNLAGYAGIAFNSSVGIFGAQATRMYIDGGSGNVGIGTTTSTAKLDVMVTDEGAWNEGIAVHPSPSGSAAIMFRSVRNSTEGTWYVGRNAFGGAFSIIKNGFGGSSLTRGDEAMRIDGGNGSTSFGYRVGIGTAAPECALDVRSAAYNDFTVRAYLAEAGAGDRNPENTERWPISISADYGVKSPYFLVSSDARIKRVTGRSSGAADLATLQKIEVTDYVMKDAVAHNTRPQKKVIAQQIEKVYPAAVAHSTGVVPDIFQKATVVDGWVQLATDLKPGERVRLLADKAEGVHEVLEVAGDRFRTAFKPAGDQVFVYGREVKDFRSVDYESIAMLNVSATQEIKREKDAEVTALRSANAELAARVAELEAKDRARDAQLASIEKLLSASRTVMARPAVNANGQE